MAGPAGPAGAGSADGRARSLHMNRFVTRHYSPERDQRTETVAGVVYVAMLIVVMFAYMA